MAQQFLTDKTSFAATLDNADLIHVVDVSDTSQNAAGSSFKLTLAQLKAFVAPPTPTLNEVLQAGNLTDGENITVSPADAIVFQNTGATFSTYLTNDQATAGNRTVYLPIFDGTLTYKTTTLNSNYILKGTTNEAVVSSSLIYDNGINVGIGTASPSYKLNVQTNINSFDIGFLLKNTNAGTSAVSSMGVQCDTTGALYLGALSSTNTAYSSYGSAGHNFIYSSVASTGLNIIHAGSNNIRFAFDISLPIVTIQQSNNSVGIVETSPTARLHLKGSTNDSTAYAFKADNLAGSPLLYVRNDNRILVNSTSTLSTVSILNIKADSVNDISTLVCQVKESATDFSAWSETAMYVNTLGGTTNKYFRPIEVRHANNNGGTWLGAYYAGAQDTDLFIRSNTGSSNPVFYADLSATSVLIAHSFGAAANGTLDVNGTINAVSGYKFNNTSGFTGTGAYTNFTIQGGIITAAS